MGLKSEKNDLSLTSQVVILIFYTIFVGMHVIITFLFDWDKWILLPIAAGVVAGWVFYIGGVFKVRQRLWLIASFMMVTYFIYGTHLTSTYDLAIVMTSLMILFITTGMKGTIILCLITYYITMTYDVVKLALDGMTFDSLIIARTIMHYSVMAMIAWFSVNTIKKWNQIMDASKDEIEELQDSTERLNDFLANVSHEIRTPVNAIIGLTGICIDKEKNPEIERDMREVRLAGRKVANQIGDILDFSEVDRRNAVKNPEDFMLSSMMNDLMMDIREIMKDEVELVIDIDARIPAVMNSDVAKLKKIILALTSNAIKYTNNGGVYLKLSPEEQPYGINLIIEITDTGVGMSEAELERVMERFYQSDSGRARSSGGLGLGLAIVSGFVELLGGFMTIQSKVDEGTMVRVSLPMSVVDEAHCMSIQSSKKPAVGSYLHVDNLSNPSVREFYTMQAIHMSLGLGMEIIKVDSRADLDRLVKEKRLTHLIVGWKEYAQDKDYLENLAKTIRIYLLSGPEEKVPADSRLKRMDKPIYAFPLVSVINSDESDEREIGREMKLYGVRALVVDDEPMNIVVAKSIFKRYEMVVDSATSGREAVECCRGKGYDIIFMDHMMSGMDGVEAMKKIRSDVKGVNHETPMVALTANAMSSAKQMFLSEGFDGFVSKPIEIEELERTIRKVLPKNMVSYVDAKGTEAGNPADSDTQTVQKSESSDVLKFSAGDDRDISEFGADGDVLEFSAGGSDDILEFSAGDGSADEPPKRDFAEVEKKLVEYGVSVDDAHLFLSNDDDLYEQLLIQFAEGVPERVEKLNGFLESKDIKNYEVLIHSTKSNTKMIGFMEISEDARKLEEAANEGNEEYIAANHERVVNMCLDAASFISGIPGLSGGREAAPAKGEDEDASFEVLEFGPVEGGEQA